MGSETGATGPNHKELRYCGLHSTMDQSLLVPRTVLAMVYPSFKSMQAITSNSPQQALAWLHYWVILGMVSLLELWMDPQISKMSLFTSYLYLCVKCAFLVWCMVPEGE